MSTVDKENLIWTVAETKDMFQEHRLWPSFVGTNFDQERRASKGRLPVMIWPEQRRYLNERKKASQDIEISTSRKRKHDATVTSNEELNDKSQTSKKIKKLTILGGFSSLANRAAAAVNTAFSYIFGWKNATASQLVANIKEESEISLSAPCDTHENIPVKNESNTAATDVIIGTTAANSMSETNVNSLTENCFSTNDIDETSGDRSLLDRIPSTVQSSTSIYASISNSDRVAKPAASSSSSVPNEDTMSSVMVNKAVVVRKVNDQKKYAAEVQMTIFRSLQVHHGYFIGPGDVYGGDYTIYRGGDPSNSHSTATVRVVRQRKISARDILSFSRVQNQVAKSAVLGFIDPSTKEAAFLVVNFQNVSDRA